MDFGALFGDLQQKMQDMKDELERTHLEADSGDGRVRVVITGKKKVEEVHVDASLLQPENKEELEDLLVVALNRAQDRADAKAAEAMHGVTGGMLPGGLGGLLS